MDEHSINKSENKSKGHEKAFYIIFLTIIFLFLIIFSLAVVGLFVYNIFFQLDTKRKAEDIGYNNLLIDGHNDLVGKLRNFYFNNFTLNLNNEPTIEQQEQIFKITGT
jgi:hypothetical protein